MSKRKKSPRDKAQSGTPDRPLSKSPSDNKRNGHGKKELRQTTAAATVVTAKKAEAPPEASPASPPSAQQAAKPAQAPARQAPAAAKPAQTQAKPATVKPAQTVAKPEPVAAKPAVKPEPAAAKPAVKPQPIAVKQAAAVPPHVIGTAVETFELSLKEAREGTIAVNRKLIDFAQANLNSSLDHVKDLAAARSPVRIMRLQMEYWHDCLETFASQAQELRALSAEFVAKTSEPIRQHMRSLPHRAA
jgi:hypothetical protein